MRILLCAALLGASTVSSAAPLRNTAPPVDLAAALAMPVASGLVGADDAPRFAWVEAVAGVRNLWVADAGRAPRRVSAFDADDGLLLYDLALTRDGARLAFVRGGDEEFPDDADPNTARLPVAVAQQVFVQPLDTPGAAVRIGEGHSPAFAPDGRRIAFSRGGTLSLWDGAAAKRIAKVPGEIDRLTWSPDGTRLLFVETRGDHAFVALLDVARATLTYLDPGPDSAAEPVFSPDGARVAFVRAVAPPPGAGTDTGPYWSIRVADVATGATRTLWSAPAGPGARWAGTRGANLHWGADGTLVFPWEASGWLHPHAIDAAKGGTPRDLTPGAFEVESYRLAADRRSLVYAANAGDLDHRRVWRVALAGGAPVALTGRAVDAFAPVMAGDRLAAVVTDVRHPARVALIDARGATPVRGDDAAYHAAAAFRAPEPATFRAADGVTVHAQFFAGAGAGAGRHPAMIFIHGGPRRQMLLGFHPSGYYSNAYVMNQHLAAQGYDVLSVNYRGGTGYGLAFRAAAQTGREGASEYRDILAAAGWLKARSDVDPARIGLWGGSWGGYLTALGLARDSATFAAGVDLHGVHTLLRAVPDTIDPAAQAAARTLMWQSSPMASLSTWRSPVLLIHGDDDHNVAFAQSVLLARELAARRIPHETLALPNERHGFLRHESWLAAYRAADAFLARTVKDAK